MRLLALLASALLVGCAPGLSTVSWPDRQPIDRDSVHVLSGVYDYVGEARRCTTAAGSPCSVGFLDALSGSRTLDARSAPATHVALRVHDAAVALTVYGVDGVVVHERVLEGDLSSDGYVVTSATRASLTSVPVAWTLRTDGVRFGLSSTGALLVEHEMSGLLFLVAFPFFGVNDASAYTFSRRPDPPSPSALSGQAGPGG